MDIESIYLQNTQTILPEIKEEPSDESYHYAAGSSAGTNLTVKASGEIFRLAHSQYQITCAHCPYTFTSFSEFIGHVEQHFFNDIKPLVMPEINLKYDTGAVNDSKPFAVASIVDPVAVTSADDWSRPTVSSQRTASKVGKNALQCTKKDLGKPKKPRDKYCSLCNMTFVRRDFFEDHMRTHQTTGKSYECYLCRDKFKTYYQITTHMRVKHVNKKRHFPHGRIGGKHKLSGTKFPCHDCGKVYRSNETLYNHMMNMHLVKKHSCQICERKFMIKFNVDMHLLKNHIKAKNFECYLCHREYKTFSLMRNHLKGKHVRYRRVENDVRAEPRAFQCHFCGGVFNMQVNLNKHLVNMHKDQLTETKCTICERVFANVRQHKLHMTLQHPKSDKQFECYVCHKSHASQTQLRGHFQYKHLRPEIRRGKYLCTTCKSREECVHMRQLDNGELQCKFCQKLFARKQNIRVHIRLHSDNPKPFKCDVCGHAFGFTNALRKHIQVRHMNQKPEATHKCELCDKSFSKRSLKRHMDNVHVDPNYRPFICSYCGKGFPTKTRLSIHVIDHKYYGKYRCKLCPKHYARPHQFRDHINKAHGGEGDSELLN